jgi:small subunit ribosomal protein S4e
VLRDMLEYANTASEAKKILSRGEVHVDGKAVREAKHPTGLMDVISFPSIKKQFRVVAASHGLGLHEIPAKESTKKLCTIKGKTLIKGGRYQISLHDGRSIIVGKEKKYKPGDSVLIEVPTQKILGHWQMKPGVPAMIVSGKNTGVSGKIKAVHARKRMQEKGRVVLETKGGDIETLYDYVLIGEIK